MDKFVAATILVFFLFFFFFLTAQKRVHAALQRQTDILYLSFVPGASNRIIQICGTYLHSDS